MLSFSSWELAVVRRRLLAESVQKKEGASERKRRSQRNDFSGWANAIR